MSVLSRLGLLDFALVDIIPTAPGELEYYVTLESVPVELCGDEPKRMFSANLPDLGVAAGTRVTDGPPSAVCSALPAGSAPDHSAQPTGSVGADPFPVSDRERQLLLAKRSALGVVRKNLRRLRGL